jgi:hypothetical protein
MGPANVLVDDDPTGSHRPRLCAHACRAAAAYGDGRASERIAAARARRR